MGKSSCFSEGIDSLAVLEHWPEHGDTAARGANQRLGLVFSFAAFNVVEGLGVRVLRAEGDLLEDTFERFVSAERSAQTFLFSRLADAGGEACRRRQSADVTDAGDESFRRHHPHPGQRPDEGALRVQDQTGRKVLIEAGDLCSGIKGLDGALADQLGHGRLTGNGQSLCAGGGKGGFVQHYGGQKMRGVGQMRHDPPLSRLGDFGRGGKTDSAGQRPLGGDVETAFRARMRVAQRAPQTVEAACLLLCQIAVATDLESERHHRLCVGQDRVKITDRHQIDVGAGVAGGGLARAPGKALARAVDSDTKRMGARKTLGQQERLEEKRERPHDVGPNRWFSNKGAQVIHEGADPRRRVLAHPVEAYSPALILATGAVQNLGDIHPDRNPQGASLYLSRPRLASFALPSPQGHRVIRGRAKTAQLSKPTTAAGKTTLPTSSAPQQFRTDNGATKRGKSE